MLRFVRGDFSKGITMATSKRVSVKGLSTRATKALDKRIKTAEAEGRKMANDSFLNFSHQLGIGADNPLTSATYGFNPVTQNRTILEWAHRGSWIAGRVVDVVAEDMTRAGVNILGDMDPEDISKIQEDAVTMKIWTSLCSAIKWARLYGGAIAVMMIDGQDMRTPLRIETVGKNQFKGLLVLDRWMAEPNLNDLITTMGPDLGKPKFYRVLGDGPAMRNMVIHHSRCVRLIGIELPYWQAITLELWGESVIERLWDRMIGYDSASTGAAQLVYKAFLRVIKFKGLRNAIAENAVALRGIVSAVSFMSRYQGNEGLTILDDEDSFEATTNQSFAGLADALDQFGQQLSGATEIPLVRLFGQSPAGFNTGDTDLRNYYDKIKKQQDTELKVDVTKIFRAIAQSREIAVDDGFSIEFRSLWQMTDKEKADTAKANVETVTAAKDAGLISDQVAMKELKQASEITGIFTNISDEDIDNAPTDIVPPLAGEVLNGAPGDVPGAGGAAGNGAAKPAPAARDATPPVH